MRILLVHNYYQQPGGEDLVYADEARLLAAHGHDVIRYEVHNDSVGQVNKLLLASRTVWSQKTYRRMQDVIRHERPDLVHFHNTLPLVSPSAYHSAAHSGVPVVQTVHNYRLVCPNGLLFRDGAPCEDCVGRRFGWPGILHACYRNSRAASATVATMNAVHHVLGTWTRHITLYIALTNFAKERLLQGGIPPERVVVKPNFVDPDPGIGAGDGGYALFVGRLTLEKGIRTLLAAWKMPGTLPPLRIVGDGPLAGEVAEAASGSSGTIEWLGTKTTPEVHTLMAGAMCLVCPSEWYETFGRVVIEAFAAGTPVIGSSLGAIAELVRSGETGLLFEPGSPEKLAVAVRDLAQDTEGLERMRRACRQEFVDRFTADRNYTALVQTYRLAIERHHPVTS